MADYEQIPTYVLLLVLVGMVLGAGVLILDKFSSSNAATEVYAVSDENITWGAVDGTITLTNGNITTFTQITNDTGAVLSTSNYTVDTSTGVITIVDNTSACKGGQSCYADYSWRDYGTATIVSLVASRGVIASISSTWLTLIITILVLSIILVLIIRSFGQEGR